MSSPVGTAVRAGVVGALAAALVAAAAGPAAAASSSAGRDNFWRNCDASVTVSDATSPGDVEVYGGWACATGTHFQPSSITMILYYQGREVKRSKKSSPSLESVSNLAHWIAYPDWSSRDAYHGAMLVEGPGVKFTLTTRTIRT